MCSAAAAHQDAHMRSSQNCNVCCICQHSSPAAIAEHLLVAVRAAEAAPVLPARSHHQGSSALQQPSAPPPADMQPLYLVGVLAPHAAASAKLSCRHACPKLCDHLLGDTRNEEQHSCSLLREREQQQCKHMFPRHVSIERTGVLRQMH